MLPDVLAALARNRGLITRREALAAGLAPGQVDRLVRSGAWVAVRRGVYAERELWESLDRHRERPRCFDRAASLSMVTPHVMSHTSAALELGLDVLLPDPRFTHITRPGVLGSRTRCGVKHHKAVYHPSQVEVVDGRPMLDRARTAVDIAREHGLQHGVVACDSALRAGVPRARLERAYAPMRNWPGVTAARAAVELADAGAESVGESLARLLVWELGIGRPQTQFGLTDGHRTVWCDLRVGRHVFEFDGRVKYLPADRGGVGVLPPEEVVWREKQRQDWLAGLGLGVSRIVWDDLWGAARRRTRERLLREYDATVQRTGASIDDLSRFVIRRPRR